HCLYCRNGE
ncbi:peptidase M16 inactive domain protein, partial [Vibrio harveyi]